MKNRIIGFLIIGIAALIGFVIFSFNKALTDIVSTSCTHGITCPMWGAINVQTNISLGIMIFIIAIGLYLIFFGTEEKIITKIKKIRQQIKPKKLTIENYKKVMGGLSNDEKLILKKIIESQGTIFQSDLVNKAQFSKVRTTRILDRLEGKDIIERRRRGMTNIVILKHRE